MEATNRNVLKLIFWWWNCTSFSRLLWVFKRVAPTFFPLTPILLLLLSNLYRNVLFSLVKFICSLFFWRRAILTYSHSVMYIFQLSKQFLMNYSNRYISYTFLFLCSGKYMWSMMNDDDVTIFGNTLHLKLLNIECRQKQDWSKSTTVSKNNMYWCCWLNTTSMKLRSWVHLISGIFQKNSIFIILEVYLYSDRPRQFQRISRQAGGRSLTFVLSLFNWGNTQAIAKWHQKRQGK